MFIEGCTHLLVLRQEMAIYRLLSAPWKSHKLPLWKRFPQQQHFVSLSGRKRDRGWKRERLASCEIRGTRDANLQIRMGNKEQKRLSLDREDFLDAQLIMLLRKSNSARLAATITCSERAAAEMSKRTDGHLGRGAELLHSAKVFCFFIVIIPLTVSSVRTLSCVTDRRRVLNKPESWWQIWRQLLSCYKCCLSRLACGFVVRDMQESTCMQMRDSSKQELALVVKKTGHLWALVRTVHSS